MKNFNKGIIRYNLYIDHVDFRGFIGNPALRKIETKTSALREENREVNVLKIYKRL